MKTYLVRLPAEQDGGSGEIVGIFAAEDENQLAWLVDECCDVGSVEVTELGAGGIFWNHPVKMRVPIETDEDGEAADGMSNLPSGETFSCLWADTFFGPSDAEWRPIDAQAE